MGEFFATLEFRYVGGLGLIVFIWYLRRFRKPSLFGMIFALLCVYLPFSDKFPFALISGVNLLNGTFLTLWILGRRDPGAGKDDSVKLMAVKWAGISAFAMLLTALFHGPFFAGEQLSNLKRWLDPLILYWLATHLKDPYDRAVGVDGILLGLVLFSADLALEGADIGNKVRVGGGMGQANAAAAFVAAYSPLVIAMYVTTPSAMKKLILVGAMVICFWAEMQTVSRAGAIGFGVSLLVAASLSRRLSVNLVVWCLAGIILVVPTIVPDKLASRFEGKDMPGNADTQEAEVSAKSRLAIWQGAMSMIMSNPLGVGFGGFPLKIGEYGGPDKKDAHNMYLLVWAEMGLVGLLIFLALLFQLGKRGWQNIHRGEDPISFRIGLALVGGLAGLVFVNFFSVTMRDGSVFGYLWILAALAYKAREPLAGVGQRGAALQPALVR